MVEAWNQDISYEFLLYKIIMWPLGLWPLNNGKIFSDVRLVIAALTQVATSICLTSELLLNCNGVENALDLLVLDIFASLACVKGIIVKIHEKEMCSNVMSALKDWYGDSDETNKDFVRKPKYRQTMMEHARTGRIVCYSLMGPASGGTLSWIIFALPLPIFNYALNGTTAEVTRNFPLQTACTFEGATDNFILYCCIFLLQIVQLVATCFGNCGNDVFFFGIAMHICGQFEILKMQISTIGTDNDEKQTGRRLIDLAKRHSHLIDLVDKLDNTFHLIILAQLAMSALLICIMGVQVIIALKTDDAFTGMKATIVLSSLMSQLFLYSYGGECLTSQNEKLGPAIYESLWFNLTPRTIKDLIFIMMRAGKPIRVTAGKFFVMTLATFMDILKLSLSYMSFLRVMIDV
uniref:Odorant receptor n=1 Tax=Campoletis chlorideae TaxID=219166 RepID=A0A346D3Z5_9HYME|nr:odorant receptor [Campoletis chlorideae]